MLGNPESSSRWVLDIRRYQKACRMFHWTVLDSNILLMEIRNLVSNKVCSRLGLCKYRLAEVYCRLAMCTVCNRTGMNKVCSNSARCKLNLVAGCSKQVTSTECSSLVCYRLAMCTCFPAEVCNR